ncbi:hypothetical protein [Nocardia salmonicida]|uniref:hypothetical protein n=1 Tax=Nocardia salmonicida TaxID=53431 RepID=UPI003400CB8F
MDESAWIDPLKAPKGGEGLRVYRLADPARLLAAIDVIHRMVASPGQSSAESLYINPVSGHMRYDMPSPGDRRRSALELNAIDRAAEGWLRQASARSADNDQLRRLKIPVLFPSDVQLVWGGQLSTGIHFRRFGCRLRLDSRRMASVEGASVDVRLDDTGAVVGFTSRWRPITGYEVVPTVGSPAEANQTPPAGSIVVPQKPAPPVPSTPASTSSLPHEAGETVYPLGGDNCPQRFLAPYLMSMDEHHGGFTSLSAYGFTVRLDEDAGDSGVTLHAHMIGGSGQFDTQWLCWSPAEVLRTGIIDLGDDKTARIPPGAWTVAATVNDRRTTAVVRAEKLVFARAGVL